MGGKLTCAAVAIEARIPPVRDYCSMSTAFEGNMDAKRMAASRLRVMRSSKLRSEKDSRSHLHLLREAQCGMRRKERMLQQLKWTEWVSIQGIVGPPSTDV